MDTDTLTQLLGWKTDAFHIAIVVGIAGRLYHAAGGFRGLWSTITTRGGIVGIVRAILFGTNTPKS